MKRLRNISLFNWFIIAIFIIFLFSLFVVDKKSKYNGNETEICGYVTELNVDSDKIMIELQSKEKIIGYYYFSGDLKDDYNFGDNICLYGSIGKIENNRIFNLFNYRKYLLSKNIYFTFSIDSIVKISDNNKLIYKVKNILKERILMCKESNPYLLAFVLGDSRKIKEEVMDNYRDIGVSHLFAVSGMHINFISTFIMFLLNIKLANVKFKIVLLSIIMLLIGSIFNSSPSIIRALLLFLCLSFDKIFNLKQRPIKYLIVILLLNLIINRYLIYNIGFVFSYTISFFLLFYQNKISEIKGSLAKSFIISLISFLLSIPILINNFFTINLLSPIFNLIIIPFVSFLLFPLSFLCLLFPFLDSFYFLLINILEYVVDFFASLKNFVIPIASMPIIVVIMYYLIIIVLINDIFKKKYKTIIIFLVMLFMHYNIRNFNFKKMLYVIDVGQGDCNLLTLKNNTNILIDTGGIVGYKDEYKSDIASKKLISFFWSIGVHKINYLVLTHGDYDHMGEAINLVENFKVEKVIFNCGEFNELEQNLIKTLDTKKIPYYSCIKELNIDNNKLYFLQTKDYRDENDNSSVIYTKLNNHKFLFMGDAGVEVEEDLIEKYNLQDIDVLKVGHHGSRTSSSKEFIDEINSEYSIISVGKNNRYGHPNKEVLDNLKDSKIYRTDQDGSIMFKIKNNKLKIETCSP